MKELCTLQVGATTSEFKYIQVNLYQDIHRDTMSKRRGNPPMCGKQAKTGKSTRAIQRKYQKGYNISKAYE